MSANDEVKCPNCNTVATEKTWDLNDGKCLSCGYVWLEQEEQPQNSHVHTMPSRIKPIREEQVEANNDGGFSLSDLPWKKILLVVVFSIIAIIVMFSIDAAMTNKLQVTSTPTESVPVVVSTFVLETPQSTDLPTIYIEGIQETQEDTVVLRYFFSDDVATNELKTMFSVAFLVIILLVGFLDRKRSHQNSDAIIAVIVILVFFLMGMSKLQQVIITGSQVGLMIALWVVPFAFLGLLLGAILSGAFDLTPAVMVFGVVAIGGGVLMNNLGTFQTLFGISSDYLYTLSSMKTLSDLHLLGTMGMFTMLTYGHFLIAILFSFIEIVRPNRRGMRVSIQNFYGFFLSILVIALFVLLRSVDIPSGHWYSFLANPIVLALLFIAVDFIFANIKREQMDGYGVSYTEYVLGNQQIASPYDLILFQVLVGAFLLVLIGKI